MPDLLGEAMSEDMKQVRVGIIGMGGFGVTEAEVVQSMPNAKLAAGEPEFTTPDDAYASTVACLAADLSMARDGASVPIEEVEAGD